MNRLLNAYSSRYTPLGLEMAEHVLDEMVQAKLIKEESYPMYRPGLVTIIVLNYLNEIAREHRATASCTVEAELNTICEILEIPLWEGGFNWDYYVINKKNPGRNVGSIFHRDNLTREVLMTNSAIPDYVANKMAIGSNSTRVVEAVDYPLLPEFSDLSAACWIMSGEIYRLLSGEASWNVNRSYRRVLTVDL